MRQVSRVAREIADVLEEKDVPGLGHTVMGIRPETLRRWLLMLAPPQKKRRPRDPVKAAKKLRVKDMDAFCRAVVFARDQNKCRRCGRSDLQLHWSHVYSRRFKWLRWDLDNSCVLCAGDHFWWHDHPLEAAEWWQNELGPAKYSALRLRAARPRKVDLLLVRKYLESGGAAAGGLTMD